ncbi:hypothetical protein BDR05DRAFT_954178, partial [Suillus weaverae]
MSSLPASYNPHISVLMASVKVLSILLTMDVLMSTIVDEYDCCASKSKKNGLSSKDAAYNAIAGKRTRCIKGNCHGCGKYGHMQHNCRGGKGGEKLDGKGKDKQSETAASTKDKGDDEPEGVWLMDDTGEAGEEQTSFTYVTLAISNSQHKSHTKLFNSGALRHML